MIVNIKLFLKKCIDSDFVYVCNKDGYLGKTVMLELGYMLGKGQDMFDRSFTPKPSFRFPEENNCR